MNNILAILGGKSVREKPYPVHTTIIDDAEEREVIEVLRGGHLSGFSARPGDRFLGGPKVKELEKQFSEYFNVKYAITFNSATSALHGAISAAKIGPGDEVITSPYTMSATPSSILMQNAIPVFADIEDKTYGLDPISVNERVTERTKAILTVNLFGHPSRLKELKEIADMHGLLLIEDNAQAPGAVYHDRLTGTIGQMGIQSLNYHKTIQTGEGGVIITNDSRLTEHLQLVRNHGEVVVGKTKRDDNVNVLGWNYRLTEVQAAIGIPQLAKLDYFNSIRQELSGQLTSELKQFDFLSPPIVEEGCTHVYYLYPVRFHEDRIGISRSNFIMAMKAEGISLSEGYMMPIYLEPLYKKKVAYGNRGCPFSCHFYDRDVDYGEGLCPTTERLYAKEMMITDICKYPNNEQEVEEFVAAVKKIMRNLSALKKLCG
jgi:dTDP-4-amino-4,6-dideoxygalactose transaminase|tara:strand:- start:661 stop:1953 length:1293 start_codon:yes stop_codon:yes gene_type:complete